MLVLSVLVQFFAKVCGLRRNQLDQLVQEMSAMNAVLAEVVCDGKDGGRRGILALGIVVVEPCLLLRGPYVTCAHPLKSLVYGWIANLHGLHGVWREGDAGADFLELSCLFKDFDFESTTKKGDCEREARHASADDGELKMALMGLVDGHCVSRAQSSRRMVSEQIFQSACLMLHGFLINA